MSSPPPAPASGRYPSSSTYNGSGMATGRMHLTLESSRVIPAPSPASTLPRHIPLPFTKDIPQPPQEISLALNRSHLFGQGNDQGPSFLVCGSQPDRKCPVSGPPQSSVQPALPTPPRTPKIGRLPTPDIEPWEEHLFCSCCNVGGRDTRVVKEGRTKQWATKAKMDAQLQAAMEYMRRRKAE